WHSLAILHRLDKETSGLLLFGKSSLANKSLTDQFARRKVHKTYHLLTRGKLPRESLTVSSKIARVGERYKSGSNGEPAETRFKLIKKIGDKLLIAAEPVTGRTHQIRVHASENGFPILGDLPYGGAPAPRLCLHACELQFQHPASHQFFSFRAEPDFDRHPSLQLRSSLFPSEEHTAYRLIHGAADKMPGFYLDRFGDFLLAQSELRPTPAQMRLLESISIEHGSRATYHKTWSRHTQSRGVEESSPALLFGDPAPDPFTILENGLRYEISFRQGYSVGIFPDQRDNRRSFLNSFISPTFPFPEFKNRSLLNTFAYTCGFSVAAAKAGWQTTSLDLSGKYLDWGKRNMQLNAIDPAKHDFIFGDVFEWMNRLAKKERKFSAIVLDPPTFSHSKNQQFRAERDYARLVAAALPLLERPGLLFASTNAARLAPEEFILQVETGVRSVGRIPTISHFVPQPPDFPITREEPAYLKTLWLLVE
ncbi:MAG: pseudouridine synthase, partial [Verrucomicrobiota bacterium]|nr:pseudouridine synthase [Verrucomicrobiota bacterium]